MRDNDSRNCPEADGRNEGHLRAGRTAISFHIAPPIIPKEHLAYRVLDFTHLAAFTMGALPTLNNIHVDI